MTSDYIKSYILPKEKAEEYIHKLSESLLGKSNIMFFEMKLTTDTEFPGHYELSFISRFAGSAGLRVNKALLESVTNNTAVTKGGGGGSTELKFPKELEIENSPEKLLKVLADYKIIKEKEIRQKITETVEQARKELNSDIDFINWVVKDLNVSDNPSKTLSPPLEIEEQLKTSMTNNIYKSK